jgi:hypothetical protein
MSDSPTPLSPTPGAPELTLESLAEAQQSLRAAFHITLVFLIILAGSLFVFFLREVSLARRQITELTQAVAEYEKNTVPVMEEFRGKLRAFAATHPDFNPIYRKYFGTNMAPLGHSSQSAQPLGINPIGPRLPPAR